MTTLNWNARPSPEGARVITTLDTHAAGEPLRIVTGGYPDLPGATILERRRYALEHHDDLRRALMWEPRGHADMYGCVLTPPISAEADFGVLFLHNEGYSTMCGHGVIALVTALIETGAFPASGAQTPVNLDTPAGLVRAVAHVDASGRVERVSFRNVPSFVYAPDLEIDVAPYGRLKVDVVFGGAFYAYLDAAQVGLAVAPEQTRELVAAGEAIKRAVNAALTISPSRRRGPGLPLWDDSERAAGRPGAHDAQHLRLRQRRGGSLADGHRRLWTCGVAGGARRTARG